MERRKPTIETSTPACWRLLESDITEPDRKQALRLLVPKPFLHGTQRRSDYDYSSQRFIKTLQKDRHGMLYFLKHPVVTVAIPEENGTTLYISDGHHRARFCRRSVVPAIIFTTKQALNIINRGNQIPLSEAAFKDFIHAMGQQALDSFSRSLPCEKYPKLISDIKNINDLPRIPGVKQY